LTTVNNPRGLGLPNEQFVSRVLMTSTTGSIEDIVANRVWVHITDPKVQFMKNTGYSGDYKKRNILGFALEHDRYWFDYTIEERVDCWLVDYEVDPQQDLVDPSKPWDLSVDNVAAVSKPCIVKHSCLVEKVQPIDLEAAKVSEGFELLCSLPLPLDTFRICGDFYAKYGDGGNDLLLWPVWYCPKLHVTEKTRKGLIQELVRLAEERKDVQADYPVEDIIDPNLFPHLLIDEEDEKGNGKYFRKILTDLNQKIQQLESLQVKPKQTALKNKGGLKMNYDNYRTSRVIENIQRTIRDFTKREMMYTDEKISEGYKLRSSYQWIPSEFRIHDGKVSIESAINGVPTNKENKLLYSYVSKVFEKMLPLFSNLGLIKKEGDTHLQVIVKAQRYLLPSGASYSGRWHMEGLTEKIVAVGVYYASVDDSLEGGKLRFRNKTTPPTWRGEGAETFDVDTSEGSCVVFSNSLPHRFRKIRNLSSSLSQRMFLNFFVVDPSSRIKSTRDLINIEELQKLLRKRTPEDVSKLICDYSGLMDEAQAKEFRKIARKSMTPPSVASGWGCIDHGNIGRIEFTQDYSTWDPYKQGECNAENLEHTVSQ
jgi:hypothetical protein